MFNGISVPPKWSRLKWTFRPRISGILLSIFLIGTLIRVGDVFPSSVSFLIYDKNNIVWLFSFKTLSFTSFEITYIGCLIYLIAYALFTISIPREVSISLSRRDYAERVFASINRFSFLQWCNEILNDPKLDAIIASDMRKRILIQRDHFAAKVKQGKATKIDHEEMDIAKAVAQAVYDYYNDKYLPKIRLFVFAALIVASLIMLMSSVDVVLKTVRSIFE